MRMRFCKVSNIIGSVGKGQEWVGGVMTGLKHGACAAGVSGVDFELQIRTQHRGAEAQKKQMTAVAVRR